MKLPATIEDVARRAKVSVGTVSNVLNGRTSVREARRLRVLAAIQELGYSSNLLAKSMRAQRSPAVGLCVPQATFSGFSSLLHALEEKASNANYEVIQVLSHGDPERELARIQRLVAFKVSGIIILPSPDPSAVLNFLSTAEVPTVLVTRAVLDDHRFDQVAMDNRAAMRTVVEGMLGLGHRRILFVYHRARIPITEQRIEALDQIAGQSSGHMSYRAMACGADQAEFRSRLGAELRGRDRPTVVIVANGTIASWAIQALHAFDIACPTALSLFALDEPEWAELVQPRLSCLRQPTHDMAQAAWNLLSLRIAAESKAAPRHVVCAGQLIFRESVEPVRPPRAPSARRVRPERLNDSSMPRGRAGSARSPRPRD